MQWVTYFVDYCTNFISLGGPIVGFLLVVLESLVPALPLGIIVALNANAFGLLFGILLSWLGTCTGSFICYSIFYYLSNKFLYKILGKKTKKQIDKKAITKFKDISFTSLVLVITLPFTPSFMINILSGVSSLSKRKFLAAILIGKTFTTIFWGYIGKSFLDSMTDTKTVIFIAITLIISYILSKIVGKRMNIE